jgi:cytochrome oxidase assembly protein ShyY1
VLFSIATSLLSWWQFSRREERVELINQVIANYDKAPIPITELDFTIVDGRSPQEWLPVEIQGTYRPDDYLLVRNRPLLGQAGFLQLVPLTLSDGRILFIERGWLIASSELTKPESNPLPAPTSHELIVRVRAGEQNLGRDQAQTLASIDLQEAAARLKTDAEVITSFYGRLVSEKPSYAAAPIPMPKPSLNEGNHLSYAIQWVLFGIMAFIAFFWAYRNDRRLMAEAQGLVPKKQRKIKQADRDAEFEDANQ